jgi:hypothetical protein
MDFLLDTLDEIAAEVFAHLLDHDLDIVFGTPPRSTGRPWAADQENDRDPPGGVRLVR